MRPKVNDFIRRFNLRSYIFKIYDNIPNVTTLQKEREQKIRVKDKGGIILGASSTLPSLPLFPEALVIFVILMPYCCSTSSSSAE